LCVVKNRLLVIDHGIKNDFGAVLEGPDLLVGREKDHQQPLAKFKVTKFRVGKSRSQSGLRSILCVKRCAKNEKKMV
jgi:hypothetical protein